MQHHHHTGQAVSYRVEGMDCASCAVKITGALSQVEGVSDPKVSITSQRLNFHAHDSAAVTAARAKVASLGYLLVPVQADGHRHHDHQLSDAWWRTGKGRLAIVLGLSMLASEAAHMMYGIDTVYISIAAALAGLVYFGRRAIAGLRAGYPFSIEMLVSSATIGALAIGAAAEAGMVMVLFLIGEILESVAAGKARAGMTALATLLPETAQVVDEHGKTTAVSLSQVIVGQHILVRAGERFPADGVIVDGTASVDQSALTGESLPVEKHMGESVAAGSLNLTGMVTVEVSHAAADNTINRIIRMVEEAEQSKSPTARFIDTFSSYYTPVAVAAAVLTAVVPPLVLGAEWMTWVYRGLGLLLIACPCALVLSTPAAIAAGIASGARRGLLIKGGAALETIGSVKVMAFDKTGTLTQGTPQVTDVVAADVTEGEVLGLAAALERGSTHPLALAILNHAEQRAVVALAATQVRSVTGKGIEGMVGGRAVSVVSPRHVPVDVVLPQGIRDALDRFQPEGKTTVVVVADGRVAGAIALRDEPRADARAAIGALKDQGIAAVMLTGDNRAVADSIAGALGMEAQAELMPQAKLDAIAALKQRGAVAMVGDGVNDAPALAAADVGIAMGSGTDVALETASAALMRNRVGDVVAMVKLSRATMAVIRQNIFIALGLKGVFFVTTFFGITGLWFAILADTGATVIVTLNSLRLLVARKD